MRHVSKPGQIRAVLEPRLGAIVQGIERAEEAEQRQSRRAQVLPLHEGGQGRPGWRQVRGGLFQLRDREGRSKSEAESGDAGHVSGHRQTGTREEVVRRKMETSVIESSLDKFRKSSKRLVVIQSNKYFSYTGT